MNLEDHPGFESAVRNGDRPLTIVGRLLVSADGSRVLRAWRDDGHYSGSIYPAGVISGGFGQDLREELVTQEEVDQVRILHSLMFL